MSEKGCFANYKFSPTSEVPTILGLLAITLSPVTSSMRDHKYWKDGFNGVQKVDVPKRKLTSAK